MNVPKFHKLDHVIRTVYVPLQNNDTVPFLFRKTFEEAESFFILSLADQKAFLTRDGLSHPVRIRANCEKKTEIVVVMYKNIYYVHDMNFCNGVDIRQKCFTVRREHMITWHRTDYVLDPLYNQVCLQLCRWNSIRSFSDLVPNRRIVLISQIPNSCPILFRVPPLNNIKKHLAKMKTPIKRKTRGGVKKEWIDISMDSNGMGIYYVGGDCSKVLFVRTLKQSKNLHDLFYNNTLMDMHDKTRTASVQATDDSDRGWVYQL